MIYRGKEANQQRNQIQEFKSSCSRLAPLGGTGNRGFSVPPDLCNNCAQTTLMKILEEMVVMHLRDVPI